MKRWQGLDGLRAIAVLGVMALHSGLPFYGGYGVQIFFVLSGFLITWLLRKEYLSTKKISYKQFMKRRLVRLFPALFAVIILVDVWSLTIAPAPFGEASLWGSLYAFFYLGNWAQAFPTFFPWGWLGLLGQTWSLGVEMQFYLVWPFVILFCSRKKINPLFVSIALIVVAALLTIYRATSYDQGTELSYLLNATDMNIDGLLIGSALGYSFETIRPTRYVQKIFSVLGPVSLVIILFIEINIGSTVSNTFPQIEDVITSIFHPFYGGITIIELLTATLIFSIVSGNNWLNLRILSWKPLVFIGSISYGLYLWHFPIFVGLDRYPLLFNNNFELLLAKFFFTFVFATMSFYFLEKPISSKFLSQ